MGRLKLNFPKQTHFETTLNVSITDINYGNHVGNERFLSFAHEARVRFLQSLNQNELDFFGVSLILSEAQIVYKQQVFYGDSLTMKLSIEVSSDYSFNIYYSCLNQHGSVCTQIKTGMVYFNYDKNKITNCPKAWSDWNQES